jgi:hypothetical protein
MCPWLNYAEVPPRRSLLQAHAYTTTRDNT